jgi:hypothetical protein
MNNKDLLILTDLFEKSAQQLQPANKAKANPKQHMAQESDIVMAMTRAKLVPIQTSLVVPVFSRAGVYNNTKITVSMTLSPDYRVMFHTSLDPLDMEKAKKIDAMMGVRFGKAVGDAMKKIGIVVDRDVDVPFFSLDYKTTTPTWRQ